MEWVDVLDLSSTSHMRVASHLDINKYKHQEDCRNYIFKGCEIDRFDTITLTFRVLYNS